MAWGPASATFSSIAPGVFTTSGQMHGFQKLIKIKTIMALLRDLLAAQLLKNLPAIQESLFWFLGWEDPLKKGYTTHSSSLGLPWWLRSGFDPWARKIPWRMAWQFSPVFLLGESHGQRSLVGYSWWGHKESDVTEWLSTAHGINLNNVQFRSTKQLKRGHYKFYH